MGQLLDIVEKTAADFAEDPVYRAGNEACYVIDRFIGEAPANDRHDAGAATTETLGTVEGRFEDVSEHDLLAEELYEKNLSAAEFPKLVYDAIELAAGNPVQGEQIATPDSQPETDQSDATEGDLDIEEITARLQIAAERAQLRADEDARRDRIEPEDLDQAVGGRA